VYLSRLILEPRSRLVQRDLADCQQLHRTILTAFPPVDSGTGGPRRQLRVLYRVEAAPHRERLEILVQSRTLPDWSRLPVGYLLSTGSNPQNPACKTVAEQYATLQAGQVLVFRLRANPTRKIETKSDLRGRRHGRRVEVRGEAAQLAWLRRKTEAAGIEIVSVTTRPDILALQARSVGKVTGQRVASESGRRQPLTFAAVIFDGILRVVDPIRLRSALEDGIGPGKAYGFGLLSLAPASRISA
jgi:CRISPR system Cascade subunit CasE